MSCYLHTTERESYSKLSDPLGKGVLFLSSKYCLYAFTIYIEVATCSLQWNLVWQAHNVGLE